MKSASQVAGRPELITGFPRIGGLDTVTGKTQST